MKHYFAIDGNYGQADDIVILDTSMWTEDDFMEVDDELDYYRPQKALEIASKYNVND